MNILGGECQKLLWKQNYKSILTASFVSARKREFGLEEYWDWLRRRKRILDSKDWMNGL